MVLGPSILLGGVPMALLYAFLLRRRRPSVSADVALIVAFLEFLLLLALFLLPRLA
jgi:hypothetical protein